MDNGLLIRDNLSDTGTIPSPGAIYSSPDLIIHEQVENPLEFFTSNYDKDVNQAMDIHSRINLIYVRVKNISSTPKVAYIHLFAANASLFLNTSEWKSNKLKTSEGLDYVQTDVIQPGEVGVGKVPFVFNALADHNYCHIGYVTDTPGDCDIPSDFHNYEEYSEWLHGNPNICMRNFALIDGPRFLLENSCEFSNPMPSPTTGVFEIQMGGKFPAGTRIHLYSKQIGVDKLVVSETETSQYTDRVRATVPALLRGIATLKVSLPEGHEGEAGAYASLSFYVSDGMLKAGQCTVGFAGKR